MQKWQRSTRLRELGFYWATRSGVTIAISDVVTPSAKAGLLKAAEERGRQTAEAVRQGSDHRLRTPSGTDRLWTAATDDVAAAMNENFPKNNTVFAMVDSGARET